MFTFMISREENFKWPKKLRSQLLLQQNWLSIIIEWKWNKRDVLRLGPKNRDQGR